jgi:hypothetical protein
MTSIGLVESEVMNTRDASEAVSLAIRGCEALGLLVFNGALIHDYAGVSPDKHVVVYRTRSGTWEVFDIVNDVSYKM